MKKIKLIILPLFIFLFAANTIFCGELPKDNNKADNQKKSNLKKKTSKLKSGINPDYLTIGMSFSYVNQNVFAEPPKFDNDAVFFAYELIVEFQYLFKSVLLNINFEYSNFDTEIHFSNTSSGDYSATEKWNKKVLSFILGYSKELSNNLLLIFPAVGFGYGDHQNPSSYSKHRTELYYLIINARFFIKASKAFVIGFNLNFNILLSHVGSYDHPTNGEGTSVLRKGVFFSFKIPMHFNLSRIFFISLTPWISYFHHPASDALHINTGTGTKVNVEYHEIHMFSAGANLSFGVYF